jgi:hypothetical protein
VGRLAFACWLSAVSFASGCALSDALGGDDFDQDQRYPGLDRPNAVVAGDFDRDGLGDLMVGSDVGGRVTTFRGLSGGKLEMGPSIELGRGSRWLAVADFDGDGLDDVAAAGCSDVAILFAREGFQFKASERTIILEGCPVALGAGNFDDMGLPDLVVIVEDSPAVFFYTQGGMAGFRQALFLPDPDGVRVLAVGDVEGDGIHEVAVGVGNKPGITVLRSGPVLGQTYPPLPTFAEPFALAFSDVDLDGRGDLIYSADCGMCAHLGILYGDGQGAFGEVGRQFGGSTGARAIAVGNFDRGGLRDVFASGYPAPPDLLVVPVLSRGNHGSEASRALGGAPGGVALLDVDADGDDEAVLAITTTSELVVVPSQP